MVAPANNYTFDSTVTLDVLRAASNTPFNFDWSALLPEQIDPYLDPMTFPPESNVYAVLIASLHYEGTWNVNHGHHVLPNGNFLFFNNGAAVRQSPVLELELTESEVTVVWCYASDYASGTLGDAQRLPNGNTLITYSNAGVVQEVDATSAWCSSSARRRSATSSIDRRCTAPRPVDEKTRANGLLRGRRPVDETPVWR